MADSDALRARRYRAHKAGNHALCQHRPEPTRPLTVVPDAGEVDPRAVMLRLVRRLELAHEQDPGNAMLARALQAAVLALPPAAADAADDSAAARVRAAVEQQLGWSAGGDSELLALQLTMAAEDPLRFLKAWADRVP